jgi:predicted ester cyclase
MNSIEKEARITGAVYLSLIISLLTAGQLFGSTLQEQNKAIARRAFEEILSRGRYELAEQLYAKDFVNHGIHSNASLEEDQTALKGWHAAFPNVVIVPEKLIAEDDLVTIYWIARGTNTGTGNGLPATGKRRNWPGLRSGGLSTARSKRNGRHLINFQ